MLLNRYKSRLPQKLEIQAIVRRLSSADVSKRVFLDIGMPNPLMCSLLRERGGVWVSLARSPEAAEEASHVLGESVGCLGENGEIPYDNGKFDGVVVSSDMLPAMKSPGNFIRECHRVLSGGGRLLMGMQNRKSASIINAVRRRAAARTKGGSPISASYTAQDIFKLFTDGFDVVEVDTYSRFFTELVRIHEYMLRLYGMSEAEIDSRLRKLYWLSGQLDMFCIGTRGYLNLVDARKRRWRERTAPVLSDGRSIHEAVLTQG